MLGNTVVGLIVLGGELGAAGVGGGMVGVGLGSFGPTLGL